MTPLEIKSCLLQIGAAICLVADWHVAKAPDGIDCRQGSSGAWKFVVVRYHQAPDGSEAFDGTAFAVATMTLVRMPPEMAKAAFGAAVATR